MSSIEFLTLEGKGTVEQSRFGCTKYENTDIWVCYAPEMGELAKDEAHHHDHDDEDPTLVHQLDAWRNVFYHQIIWNKIKELPKGSTLLEIGAGSGYDAEHFVNDHSLVLTDVSPKTLERLSFRLKEKYPAARPLYVACDGEYLPFADEQFDAVYMIATFHHFSSYTRALSECRRVLKSGGVLILGIEPNKTYFKPMKFIQKILYRLTHTDTHHISHADAQMEGFTKGEFNTFLKGNEWSEYEIKPMWFIAGWVHYVLEFAYRACKLKKRIKLPQRLEKAIVAFDEFLFHIPGFSFFCWHWIVTARKK